MSTIATPNQKLLIGVPPSGNERVLVNHPTQSATAIDGWKSLLFGIPFLAAGIWISYAALGAVQVKRNVPGWAFVIFGAFFFLGGLFLIAHGLLGVIRKAVYAIQIKQSPNQPWLCDYHWRREGITFSAFNTMLQRLFAALVWNAFLLPFFWIGITERGVLILFAIFAGLFALLGLFFWYRWAQMLGELLRYGNSFLGYNNFPYFLGSALSARLRAPSNLSDFDELTLTLRCVQERYVTSDSGSDRTTSVVCFELYGD